MKKISILLIAIFAFNIANAQQYYPFPDNNVVWNFSFYQSCQYGHASENYSIIISGDTIINSITYHKLSIPFVQTVISGNCNGIDTAGYKGAIRQDIANKKVYYISPIDTSEQLLYDFAMQVGDTVKGYTQLSYGVQDIVQSIDSVLVGNTYRKRLFINPSSNIYFIESIGSTYGLVNKTPYLPFSEPIYNIICFQQNGQSLYPDTTTNCQIIVSIKSINETDTQIKLYPNPAKETLTIETDATNQKLEIINLLGETIHTIYIYKKATLNTSAFANGIYIIKIPSKKGIIVRKFVKE